MSCQSIQEQPTTTLVGVCGRQQLEARRRRRSKAPQMRKTIARPAAIFNPLRPVRETLGWQLAHGSFAADRCGGRREAALEDTNIDMSRFARESNKSNNTRQNRRDSIRVRQQSTQPKQDDTLKPTIKMFQRFSLLFLSFASELLAEPSG